MKHFCKNGPLRFLEESDINDYKSLVTSNAVNKLVYLNDCWHQTDPETWHFDIKSKIVPALPINNCLLK